MIFWMSAAIGAALSTSELLDDRRDVVGLDVRPVVVVDGDDRRPTATAEALDGAERHLSVPGGLAGATTELGLERLHDLLRADDGAGDVRTHLDEMLAHRCEVELVVERGDRRHVGGRHLERVGDFAEYLRREPAVLALREPQRGQD